MNDAFTFDSALMWANIERRLERERMAEARRWVVRNRNVWWNRKLFHIEAPNDSDAAYGLMIASSSWHVRPDV